MNTNLTKTSAIEEVKLYVTENYFHLAFATPTLSLSSSIYNGGLQYIDHFVNLKVEENFKGDKKHFPSPQSTMSNFFTNQNIIGNNSGMMTAASMKSFRHAFVKKRGVTIECYLTAGLSNARCAGDPADWPYFDETVPGPGTINIVLGTDALLSETALTETIITVTEAKSAVLAEMKIRSKKSNRIATGTGTDSVMIFCRKGKPIKYCGKHVLFGEMIGEVIETALRDSLLFYTK